MPDQTKDNAGKAELGLGRIADLSSLVQALISNAGAGIYLAQNGKFVYINPFLEELSGYPSAELLGHNCSEFVHPDDRDSVKSKAVEALKYSGNNAPAYEYRFVKKSGEIMWVIERVSSIEYNGLRAVLGSFMDINRRKLLEEALVVYGERYRNILERMQDSYYELDLNGNLVFVNYATCQNLGYEWGELNGKNYRSIIPEDSRKKIFTAFHKVFETGEPNKGFAHKVLFKNGTIGYAESSVSLLLNDSGKPVGFTCVGRNVTERKQLEDALSRSEFRFRSILEQMQDACFEVDLAGNYIYVNDGMCSALGYSREEFMGTSFRKLVPEESVDTLIKAYTEVFNTGEPNIGVLHKITRKDGIVGISETSISLLRDEEGKPVGFLCVGRDVTRRDLLEKALKRSEEKYRSVLQQMQESYFECDLKGHYIFVNDAMCEHMGYTREELMGMHFKKITAPEDQDQIIKIYQEVFDTGKSGKAFTHKVICKDGSPKYVETSITPLRDEDGKTVGFSCVARDFTAHKQLLDALAQSEERYRNILEQLQDSYYEVDVTGNFTYVNKALCKNVGYAKEELIGQNYRLTTPENELKHMFRGFNAVYKTGIPNPRFLHMGMRRSGEVYYSETSIDLSRNSQGEITGFKALSRDITDRKLLEEELSKSEEKYRGILEEMEDAYYEVDLNTNFIFCNDQTLRDTGYSRDEFLSMNYKQVVPEEDSSPLFHACLEVFKTGVANKGYAHRITTKTGDIKSVEAAISPMKNDNGEVVGFRFVSRDVSERKQLEEELVRSEQKYRNILEQIEDAYYEVDLPGNYTFANAQACRLLGYPMPELIGKNFKDIVPAEDMEYTFKSFNEVFKTGKPNNGFAHRVIRKDGNIVYAEASVTLLRTKQGEITGFRILSRDVTERKRLEEELVRSEEKYRSILSEMEDAYYEVDLKGNFTFVNEACCRDLRSTRDELIGMNFSQVVVKEEITNVFNNFNQVYRTGESNRGFSHRILRKDGTTGYAEASVSLIKNKQGKVTGFRAVSRDVSERKKLEQKLAEMATHDFLTGLPNRILLNDRFYVAVAHAHRSDSKLAVMSLDLDRFKAVNDTMGHSAGDELLKMVAIRLAYTLRSSDTVARIGGDEFVLLLQEIHDLEDATSIAGKIVESFKGPFVIEGHYLNISTSIGLAVYPDDGKDLDILMRKSDAAMYHSKKDGGSRYKVFSDSDRQELKY
jgi:diguanylate cyclase (GGDEF)-like protein/PAS domain S-box-containing protein